MASSEPFRYEDVHDGIGCIRNEDLLRRLHETVILPLLPLAKNSYSSRGSNSFHKDDYWRIRHSAHMTQPVLLDANIWGGVVLKNIDDFRISAKHDGVRVWIVFTNVEPTFFNTHENYGPYSDEMKSHAKKTFVLSSKRLALTLLINRAGDIWILDSKNAFDGTSVKFWVFPSMFEGELVMPISKSSQIVSEHASNAIRNISTMPVTYLSSLLDAPSVTNEYSTDVSSSSMTFVLFDVICLASTHSITMSLDLDQRNSGLSSICTGIKWFDVDVVCKHWWKLKDFFKSVSTSQMDYELEKCVDIYSSSKSISPDGIVEAKVGGQLPTDGWILASIKLKPFDLSKSSSLSSSTVFKYKKKHTIDMWIIDVGACIVGEKRLFLVKSDDDCDETERLTPSNVGSLLTHNSKFTSTTRIVVPKGRGDVKICWSKRRPSDGALFEFTMLSDSDYTSLIDASAEKNTVISDTRRWLERNLQPVSNSQCWRREFGSNTFVQRNVLQERILVECGIDMIGYGTERDQLIFNLIPLKVRKDKSHANSSRVIYNTCSMIADCFIRSSYDGSNGTTSMRDAALSPSLMSETIIHSQPDC